MGQAVPGLRPGDRAGIPSTVGQAWNSVRVLATRLWQWGDMVSDRYGAVRGGMLAAAIAFYAALAVFPLVLGLLAMAGHLLDPSEARDLVARASAGLMPAQRTFLADTIGEVVEARGALGFFAVSLLIWSGRGLFSSLQTALDAVHGFQRPTGPWAVVTGELRALVFAAATLALALAEILLRLGLSDLPRRMAHMAPAARLRSLGIAADGWVQQVARAWDQLPATLPFLAMVLGLVLLFRYLPHRTIPWRDAMVTALITLGLWLPLSAGLQWYLLEFSSLNAVYGSLSGVVAFLLWLQLAALSVVLAASAGATAIRAST